MQQTGKMSDRYGLPISSRSATAAEHYVEGLDLVLSQNYGAVDEFHHAIAADAGFAMAHGALAWMHMQAAEVQAARDTVHKASTLAAGATTREQQHLEALSLFIHGQGPQAIALVHEHLSAYPRDAFLLRLAQRLYVLGCSGAGVSNYPPLFYDLMSSVQPHYGEDWAFLGQYAWANHEIGQIEEGRRLAEHSLELRPTNAVAAHSVAHVCFERGEYQQGGEFLGEWLEGFDRRAQYRVHLSWHQCLFDLAMGRYQRVLQRYDDDIRQAVVANQVRALQDSASLMWRWKLYGGADLSGTWQEVRDLALPATENSGPAFRDGHAALAFAAASDDLMLGQLIDRLRDLAAQGNALAAEATLPLVQGISAFAHGEYAEAARLLGPLHPQLTRIGGSHAQREVFEDTILEAFLRAGEFDQAEALLQTRLSQRESARDLFRVGRIQASRGQQDEASASFNDVVQRWQDADRDSPEFATLSGHIT